MRKYGKIYNTQVKLFPFIVLAQFFALFPVSGIKGNDYRTIKFSWTYKRTVYTLLYLIVSLINLCLYFIKQLKSEEFLLIFVGLVYFATTLLIEIFFIRLAKRWSLLMKKWSEVDISMETYGYSNICYKLKIICSFVMIAAFCEHTLFVASKFAVIPNNITTMEVFDIYFQGSYDQVFTLIPYNIYLGICTEIFDIYCAFAWNYRDLFIMLVSIVLSERFRQIGEKVRLMAKYKVVGETHWRTIRENYIQLCALCNLLNRAMTDIVVLSFTHNLFVVLIQFMHTLDQGEYSFIHRVYFTYSFGFLIIRTICVCLFAAEIDTESRKPLEVLPSLPSEIYNIEIERLLLQIKVGSAHLSGGGFFSITRTLILRISGAIVTYELVLIQIYKYL